MAFRGTYEHTLDALVEQVAIAGGNGYSPAVVQGVLVSAPKGHPRPPPGLLLGASPRVNACGTMSQRRIGRGKSQNPPLQGEPHNSPLRGISYHPLVSCQAEPKGICGNFE